MDYTQAIADAANDLLEYNAYSTADNGILARSFVRAGVEWWKKRPWKFKVTSGTITAEADNRGPYDLPSDFDHLIGEERTSRPGTYDILVRYTIDDDDQYIKYPVRVDYINKKLYFEYCVEAGDYTFQYGKAMTQLTDLADWPEDLSHPLSTLAKGYVLENSEDTKERGAYFKNEGARLFKQAWIAERRGQSKQEEREPRDVYRNKMHTLLNGDDYWPDVYTRI